MERPSSHGDYDPLATVDHRAMCEDFFLLTGGKIQQFILDERDYHVRLGRRAFALFQDIVTQIREVGREGNCFDSEEKLAAIEKGIVVGLSLLEHVASSLDIDVSKYYEHWEEADTVIWIDTNKSEYAELPAHRRAEIQSDGLRILGLRYLDQLPDAYTALAENIESCEKEIQDSSEAFRSGFGYVIGSGYVAMRYPYERARMGEINFEAVYSLAVDDATPTHQSIVDKFMRLIEPNDEDANVEAVLGCVMRDNIDTDERIVDTLHGLALALYTEEGELERNDKTEAFFMGANLGVHIATDMSNEKEGKPLFIARWLKSRLHQELLKYGPDSSEHTRRDATKAREVVSRKFRFPSEYIDLLELINGSQDYNEAESAAFRDGMSYALGTLLQEMESLKKGAARKTAREEAEKFDEEFESFMLENDLTGNLQEVFNAYLGHCQAFDLDPDDLTEDEADTILELTLADYDRLMPEIADIEVQGPCFLQVIENGEYGDPTALLMEKDGSLSGEIEGFRIAFAPSDREYISEEFREIGQFPWRYMPSFVLKNVRIRLANGELIEEESPVMVGFVVPGTTFRRTDSRP